METAARRPWASRLDALRSFAGLMIAEEAARPRWVAASKQTVSMAPRMMLAVTASMLTEVGSGGRFAASFLFSSNDMAELPLRKRPECKLATNSRFGRIRKARQFPHFRLHTPAG